MRKRPLFVVTLLLIAAMLITLFGAAPKDGYKYVGNSNSSAKLFHNFDCDFAKRINDTSAIYFRTRIEAINNGYSPCKSCKP